MTLPLKHVQVHRPGPGVAEVWLNRPEVRNAFNDEVIAELTQLFAALALEPTLRVVVLAGHGPAFCAGADLHWMRRMAQYAYQDNVNDATALAQMLHVMDELPVPMVARVQGDVYAGGMGLVAVCDVVVAVPSAQFCLSEARLGLCPATISPYVVRAMGVQAARRYMVTAERFDANQAHAMGLVHELCQPQDLDTRVAELVQTMLANGPAAMRACKDLVRVVANQPMTEALRQETVRRIADIRVSDEGQEGIQAFLNKRQPNWRTPSEAA